MTNFDREVLTKLNEIDLILDQAQDRLDAARNSRAYSQMVMDLSQDQIDYRRAEVRIARKNVIDQIEFV